MTGKIEFPPVQNGLDYLQSAVEYLRGDPGARELKYAVLHLQAAVEVLLKTRLIREDWSLVFPNPDKATRQSFATGDFHSIGLDTTLARLEEIAGITLPQTAKESIKRLVRVRNKLQHFGLEEQALGVESLAGEVLDALLCFIADHLKPGVSPDDEAVLDQTQELIREEMARIRALVDARESRIAPELDEHADHVVACPGCLKLSLILDSEIGQAQCLFCDRAWEGADAAGEYAASVLRISWYEVVKDGETPPVRICPDCGIEAFTRDVTVREDAENPRWACFNCGITVTQDRVGECARCGEPRLVNDEDGVICSLCWEQVIHED